MGAWIEIFTGVPFIITEYVAPLVGAWIEMITAQVKWTSRALSLPSWERGLKLDGRKTCTRRLVVAPLVGAWIEISTEN